MQEYIAEKGQDVEKNTLYSTQIFTFKGTVNESLSGLSFVK